VISLVVPLEKGEMIEAIMVGRFGMVGSTAATNGDLAISQAIVQIAGTGEWLDFDVLRKTTEQSWPVA
jgi:hypothetical protein